LFWLAVWVTLLVLVRLAARKLLKVWKEPWSARGKVVVITGASSGIGAQLAKRYAEEGAKVAVCARNGEALKEVGDKCRKVGAEILEHVADVGKETECKQFLEAVGQKFGVIDLLVLNAGVSMGERFEDVQDMAIFRTIMDTNYFGAVSCAHYALPFLTKSARPKIAVISSGLGLLPGPTRTGYCASKFALHGFFESLRLELGPKFKAEVTMVCPGVVATGINTRRLGSVPLQLDLKGRGVMSVAECARLTMDGIADGSREILFTTSNKAARWLKLLLPEVADLAVLRFFAAASAKQ